ncbi:DUF87 domain-containing protein [Chloroflexi bacterium TSY]|nr:DUF87 domain-containing protein [Chloroflexi bacterium TSY]MBV7329189.1 DUF87 domain-containing protein [Chloroflexi bacterium TSY]
MAVSRRALERQSNQIEQVLATHKIDAFVQGATATPRIIRFDLVTRIGTKVSRVSALSEEIALALNCPEARIARRGGLICIEIPRNQVATVQLLALCANLSAVPSSTAVLGLDETGQPLLIRLAAPDVAHVLIAGTTGSGKTVLLRSLLTSLAIYNPPSALQMLLIDPKRRGLAALGQLPHVLDDVIDNAETATHYLHQSVIEMEKRDRHQIRHPVRIIAIDELADLIQVGGTKVQSSLIRLSQRGREAGIHLVVCTQKPTASIIGSAIVANFPVRLVGMVANRDEARYATGITSSGAEKLGGRGDFLLIIKGESIRFQTAWLRAEDLVSTINLYFLVKA